MAGVLLDPTGRAEAIDEKEHRHLSAHLSILRSLDHQEHQAVIGAAISDFEMAEMAKSKNLKHRGKPLLSAVFFEYDCENLNRDGAHGALVHMMGEPCEELIEEEIAVLWNTLKTVRTGGWFAEWLAMQVDCVGNGDRPDDKHPSPLKIMGTLTDAVDQYEKEIDAARGMIARRPDVLIPIASARKPTPRSTRSPRKVSAQAHSKRAKATVHADAA